MNFQLKRILIAWCVALAIVLVINSTIRIVPTGEEPAFHDRFIYYLLAPAALFVSKILYKILHTGWGSVGEYLVILACSMAFYTVALWALLSLWSWMRKARRKRRGATQT